MTATGRHMTQAQVVAAVHAYRASAPRDFPVTRADRALAARLRQGAHEHPAVFAKEMRRGRR